jgi:hypothetical protein
VTLVEAATQKLLGEADLPAEQLPESFEASTTLHVYGREDAGRVACIGMYRVPELEGPLAGLAAAHSLVIVDWCAARIVTA